MKDLLTGKHYVEMKVKDYEQTISELINLIDEGIYIVDGKGKTYIVKNGIVQ